MWSRIKGERMLKMKKHIKIVSVLCCLLLCTAAAGGCNLFSQNNSQRSTAAESQSQSSSDEESIDSETSAQENKTEESRTESIKKNHIAERSSRTPAPPEPCCFYSSLQFSKSFTVLYSSLQFFTVL